MSDAGIDAAKPRPRRPRLPRLDTVVRVRHEVTKLYREGRDGIRPAEDVHQLAATLAIVGQLIEGSRP